MRRPFTIAAIAYFAIANTPGSFSPVASGLDESWKYALNALAVGGNRFGSEVVFTYGPLGFLMGPRPIGGNLLAANLFWLVIHALMIALLIQLVRSGRNAQVCGFCYVYTLVAAWGLWDEYALVAYAAIFCSMAFLEHRVSRFWSLVTAGLIAVCWYMKFSLGLSVFFLAVAGTFVQCVLLRRPWRDAVWMWGGFALISLSLGMILFESVGGFARWLSLGREIVSGYAAAMSIVGHSAVLLEALVGLVLLGLFCWFGDSRHRNTVLILIPALMISFKHAFVRQGGHSFAFFGFLPLLPAVAALFSPRGHRHSTLGFGFAAILLCLAAFHSSQFPSYPAMELARLERHLSLAQGVEHLRDFTRFRTLENSLKVEAFRNPANRLLPERWVEAILASGGNVVAFPWEISSLAVQGLDWGLLPTLQIYQAYTSKLDVETAALFASEKRPTWIWITFIQIEGRHLLSDNPRTWAAILDHYRVFEVDPRTNQLLLRADVARNIVDDGAPVPTRSLAGAWINVPPGKSLVRLAVDIQPTILGKLAKMFYQWPPVWIEYQFTGGATARFRLLTETAVGGLLFPGVPVNAEQLAELVEGRVSAPVERFRILLPGELFRPEFALTWRKTNRTLQIQAERPNHPPRVPLIEVQTSEQRRVLVRITASDEDGTEDLDLIQLILNKVQDGHSACYLSYQRSDDSLHLLDDNSVGYVGLIRPGESNNISNSQCRVVARHYRVQKGEGWVKLEFDLELHGSLQGDLSSWAWTRDVRRNESGWQTGPRFRAPLPEAVR